MTRVTIQMGHVNGQGGSDVERQFVQALAPRIAALLRFLGHQVQIMDARLPAPPGDVFVALHTDANSGPAVRGASVGYPDPSGGQLAAAWKAAHERRGWPSGFQSDNYTDGLRFYYMWNQTPGYQWRFLTWRGPTWTY